MWNRAERNDIQVGDKVVIRPGAEAEDSYIGAFMKQGKKYTVTSLSHYLHCPYVKLKGMGETRGFYCCFLRKATLTNKQRMAKRMEELNV